MLEVGDGIVFTTPEGKKARLRVEDGYSPYQDLKAVHIIGEVSTSGNFATVKQFYRHVMNVEDTGDGAIPNGDVPYDTDSFLYLHADQWHVMSENRLRNDAPPCYAVVNGNGDLIGISLDALEYQTAQGYAANTWYKWSIGAGQMFARAGIKADVQANQAGNITSNSFYHPNGRKLSADNPLAGPWVQGQQVRLAPPPPKGNEIKFDFGPGVAFIRHTAPWGMKSQSAAAAITYAWTYVNPAGRLADTGATIVYRCADSNPLDYKVTVEYDVACGDGSELKRVQTLGPA